MLPVDSLPEGRSPYGVHHMAGNVKEWVDDWYDREYYSDLLGETDPDGPIGGEFKGVRGGSWRDMAGFIYSSFRNNSYPETRLEDYGFRCAKNAGKESATKKLIQWQKHPDIGTFELAGQGRI
jgi:iron(II)-dependent oxidoreductase